MVQLFNYHYKNYFEHGWKVTVDERIFWGWAHDQPGEGRKFDRKTRGFGPEYKCISTVGVQVTTTFEHVRSKEVNNKGKYTKEYGSGAASVLLLCEASGTEGRNRAVISDSRFVGIMCVLGLFKLGLQAITIIKTVTEDYCKQESQDKLKVDDIPRGEHVAALTTLDGVKMIALAYRAKSDNGKKAKARKAKFLSYFFGNRLCHHTTIYPRREEATLSRWDKSYIRAYQPLQVCRRIL